MATAEGRARNGHDLAAAAAVRRRFRQAIIIMNRALARSDLSALQYHLLLEIAATGSKGLSQVQLAEWLAVPEPRVSVLVATLVQRGLVKRLTVRADRRRVHVVMTAKGRRLLQRASESQRRSLAEMVAGIPPDEMAGMVEWGAREYLGLRHDTPS